MSEPTPVLRGTLDILVLKALSWAPMHGYEVVTWIEERSGNLLGFDDSAVYQSLYRMEKRGLLEADWGVTENNRRARYYRLSEKGVTHLKEETEKVLRYNETVMGILTGPARGTSPA